MLSRLSGTLSSSTPSRRKKVLIVSTIVPFEIVVLVVAVALGFDFMNGFHDAANSVATVVSTRVLTPRVAVLWAAFFNFVAAFVFGVNVASTIGKGTIDPKKTMGIIAALLFAQGLLGSTFYVPFYVILLAGTAMGLGTYFGGWRIVRTMGMKITKLHPFGGFSAETAAATTLFATASLGIPVSTTHTIAGAIMGVGSTRRLSAMR